MAIDPNGNAWWNPFSWDWESIGTAVSGGALAVVGATVAIGSAVIGGGIPGSGIITQAGVSMAAYGGIMVASVFDSAIKKDMDDIGWNPFNTNKDPITNSNYQVSFYKGVPVIKHYFLKEFNGNITSASAFGVIIYRADDARLDTIDHEWGHAVQFWLLGAKRYIGIMAPSLTANLLSDYKASPGTFRRWLSDNYYNLPWERTADLFGNVTRGNHAAISLPISLAYLAGLLLI